MKEPFFWEAVGLHYFSITIAVLFNAPVMGGISLLTFALIPSLTETELVPGMRDSLEAQLEILETQMWLSREGYYENVQ